MINSCLIFLPSFSIGPAPTSKPSHVCQFRKARLRLAEGTYITGEQCRICGYWKQGADRPKGDSMQADMWRDGEGAAKIPGVEVYAEKV